ncbi:prohibitin family protein [Prolixibacteraceae bacterium]|nr:prohibitin family protein [Prolixibacteraceae bacterium]
MNKKTISLGMIAFAVIIVIAFGSQLFFTLNPGERAVIFRPYSTGLDKTNIFKPGFHVKAPWNSITIYNVKELKREERMDVLDKNGLSINIDVSVRFNPIYDQIGYLHERFGRNYVDQLVVPEVRATVRQVAGRYTAEEIYSTKRSEVEQSIIQESKKSLDKNHIEMRALLIRSINLPDQIKQAIENKLKQQQEALAYKFKLDREKSEAERKRIEAEGIAGYNRIISKSLSDNVLKQRGIEATLELSKSNNSKIIVVGSSKDGLPLILGNN